MPPTLDCGARPVTHLPRCRNSSRRSTRIAQIAEHACASDVYRVRSSPQHLVIDEHRTIVSAGGPGTRGSADLEPLRQASPGTARRLRATVFGRNQRAFVMRLCTKGPSSPFR